MVVGNKSVETLIIGSLRHPAIRGNDLARVHDNRATTGNIVDRNKSGKDKNKHHARNGAAVVNIAMTSALKHGADHGHSNSLDTMIGMDYFLEFTVTLGVTRINIHGLGEDAKMRSK